MNTTTLNSASAPTHPKARPWWRYGHVWLVVGGPLVVVVASIATYFIAASAPDPVLNTRQDASAASVGRQGDAAANPASLAPMQQARNHVATSGVPTVHPKP